MIKKRKGNMIGGWAFLIGVVIAVVIGFFSSNIGSQSWIVWLLALLGLIVGLLNIADEEAEPFLYSTVALIIVSALGGSKIGVVPQLSSVLDALMVLFVPAAVIVAVRNVFMLAKH